MSWKQVLGHDAAVASLMAAWKTGRLAHAYLFVGPQGVGKHTFARELAKALLCENRQQKLEACDVCSSCKLVAAGTHPDLFMVARPEDKIEFPIAVIRGDPTSPGKGPGLLEQLSMKPSRGGRKVAILDDADDLNEEAANCFLKTLEEPPPASVLILVGGDNAERQLPTILSRCQVIRFAPLPPGLVKRVLNEHGVTEPTRQDRLVQLAGGSPGQALALDDEEVWAFRKELLEMLRQERIDPATTAGQWMQFIENAGKDAAAHRQRASLIFRLLIVLVETALKLSLGANIAGLDPSEESILRKAAERVGEEKLLAWIERALDADRQIDRRVQLVLIVEAFVDTMCR
jgi:DNA polymerase III subunit delta'